ncbi:MAG: hypothetical protein HYV08_12965, partial [Deltaproteobacteria bacterium]|nr:hypothetical protein [Deltaproteobacteria bacterium]
MKWEYYCAEATGFTIHDANVLGERGWEMVCCDGEGFLWFKRPVGQAQGREQGHAGAA